MILVKPTQRNINELMSWFTTKEETISWGGPHFSYPFSVESFLVDLKLTEISSYCLMSDTHEQLLAFGQYYSRLNSCHLGRLVVNPQCRGRGLAKSLITQLIALGRSELKTSTASLFVYKHNKSAIKSYEKLGFEFTEYPELQPIEACLYMTKAC